MRLRAATAALLMAILAAACDKGLVDPADNTTETFSDTVPFTQGTTQGKVHAFNVNRNGELSVTFQSMAPPLANSTFPTDIRVTAQISGQCVFANQIVADNSQSIPSATRDVISGVLVTPGQYCLWIVDEGFFTQPEAYVVLVHHP